MRASSKSPVSLRKAASNFSGYSGSEKRRRRVAVLCRRQASLFPKQILHFLFGKTFYRGKSVDNLKHAAFDCVSIRARAKS
jgi:hypothetical protein